MFKKKSVCLLLVAAMAVSVLAGCGAKSEAPAPKNASQAEQQAPAEKKEMVLAVNATFPPFESLDEKDATKYVGIDMDIANYISSKLGVTFKVSDMAFGGLVTALTSGHADIIISGISPTDERKQTCDFTKSYFYPMTAILTNKDSGYNTLGKLEGKKIGCSLGTTYAEQAAAVKGAQVKELDNTPLVVQEIVNKRVDAGLFDASQAAVFVQQNPGLEAHVLPGKLTEKDSYAIALPKGSPYVAKINAILDEMEQNGEMDKILTKWLGADFVAQYKEQVKEVAAVK